uniref:Protein C, inactivator of coagulation factors Va and VIIIa n=1 Tax=Latimeria chalumnae TaxID=7897 RepID=H3B6B5_LATCH
ICIIVDVFLIVFVQKEEASRVLRIQKRANYFLEEILPGDLERECYEEACSFEEANEIYQTREKTMEFWYFYKGLHPCERNPCVNKGICKQQHYDYICLCPPLFTGKQCELEVVHCWYNNGGCQQYCTDNTESLNVTCSCAKGYKLGEDGKSCEKSDRYACGIRLAEDLKTRSILDEEPLFNNSAEAPEVNQTGLADNGTDADQASSLADSRVVGGWLCHRGSCPWQVLLYNQHGQGFCGGSLINHQWIVTASHCFDSVLPHHVTLGDFDKLHREVHEQKILVDRVVLHPNYNPVNYDNDIALVQLKGTATYSDYVIPICLPNSHLARMLAKKNTIGMISGWGSTTEGSRASRFLYRVGLPMVDQLTCTESNTQTITDNMFCAGYSMKSKDACQGDSGGPYAVQYQDTWYLTGVISWGEGCAMEGKYGVYTRLSNYQSWIHETTT